ncbi:MAG: DUF3828 domain-containing protein [Ferruginibacter sp.]|nr:DUF3828 domain-containing protein [Ferruginibacter sp.]
MYSFKNITFDFKFLKMKKIKSLSLFFVASILFFSSCAVKSNDANNTVDSFFNAYKSDFRTVNKNLITKALSEKIDSAIAKEKYDAKRLKDLQSTDKPLMIEGDIFTSIYEGYTSFRIKQTKADGKKASVVVAFENKNYNFTWENEVILLLENNTWRIDDVLYTDKRGAGKSTKDVLSAFLKLNS